MVKKTERTSESNLQASFHNLYDSIKSVQVSHYLSQDT